MDSRFFAIVLFVRRTESGESEGSEKESSSDTNETVSTEQSTRDVEIVESCRGDYADTGPVTGLVPEVGAA